MSALEQNPSLQQNGESDEFRPQPTRRRSSTTPNDTSKYSRLDPHFTQNCINAIGGDADPRAKEIASSLFRHLHDFAREVELTTDEWLYGQNLLNECGKLWTESAGKRNEMHRLSDILGLESLVDEIAHKVMAEKGVMPTSSAILGPFWSPDAPFRDLGDTIIDQPAPGALVTWMHGLVIDSETGEPLSNAIVDIWQASTNGKYDFQDPENQKPNNLRGKFRTDDKGEYRLYLLRPTAYSLPTDGPAGVILNALDRHPMRPAHIHMMISAEGYNPCTTQIYPKDDPYLTTDSVFAVKDDLVVDFVPIEEEDEKEIPEKYKSHHGGDETCTRELELNLALAPSKGNASRPVPTVPGSTKAKEGGGLASWAQGFKRF